MVDNILAPVERRLVRAFERLAQGDQGRAEAFVKGWGYIGPQTESLLRKRYFTAMKEDGSGSCLHEGCRSKVTRCHMVHESALAFLAEAGHVLEFELPRSPDHEFAVKSVSVGIGHFSTFFGYCNPHDGTFSSIDRLPTDVDPTPEQMLLWHARCVSATHVLNRRRAAIQLALAAQAILHTIEPEFRRACLLAAWGAWRSDAVLNDELRLARSGATSGFLLRSAFTPTPFPFAGAAYFTAETNVVGSPIPAALMSNPPAMTLVVVPGPRGTRVVFACADRFASHFDQDWQRIAAMVRPDGMLDLLEYCAWRSVRLGLRPSWWTSQDGSTREAVMAAIKRGIDETVLFRLDTMEASTAVRDRLSKTNGPNLMRR